MIPFPSKCWLVVYHDYFPLGAVYTYLASGAGRTQSEGTFRALTCGFIHWASGRIDSIEVNVQNPLLCPHSIINEALNEARQLSRLDIATARG